MYILGIWAGLMNPANFNCMMQYFHCFLANIHLFTGMDNVAEWVSTLDVSLLEAGPGKDCSSVIHSTPLPSSPSHLDLRNNFRAFLMKLWVETVETVSGTIRKLFRAFLHGLRFFPTGQPERAKYKVPTANQQYFYPLEHARGAQPTNTQLPGHPKMSLQSPFTFPTEV